MKYGFDIVLYCTRFYHVVFIHLFLVPSVGFMKKANIVTPLYCCKEDWWAFFDRLVNMAVRHERYIIVIPKPPFVVGCCLYSQKIQSCVLVCPLLPRHFLLYAIKVAKWSGEKIVIQRHVLLSVFCCLKKGKHSPEDG